MVTVIASTATGPREVARNLALNPLTIGPGAYVNNYPGQLSVTRENLGTTTNPQGILSRIRSALVEGQTRSQLLAVYSIDGLVATGPARFVGGWVYVNASGYSGRVGQGALTPIESHTWTWLVGTADAGTIASAVIERTTGGDAGAAHVAYLTGVTARTDMMPPATIAPGIAYTPDPGLVTYWAGTAHESESILTDPAAPIVEVHPQVVDGWEVTREVRSIVHTILNRTDPAVTLRQPGMRSGRFTMVFADEAAALTAYAGLSVPQTFTITDPDVPAVDMQFVVADPGGGTVDMTMRLDDDTRSVWLVEVPFTEVGT